MDLFDSRIHASDEKKKTGVLQQQEQNPERERERKSKGNLEQI